MGLINAKVIEKLAKTFLHAQPRFCGHILPWAPALLVHSGTGDRHCLVFGYLWQRDSPTMGASGTRKRFVTASRRWEKSPEAYLACVVQLDRSLSAAASCAAQVSSTCSTRWRHRTRVSP